MRAGRHYADFTWVAGSYVMVGVARAGLDLASAQAYKTADFWGWYSSNGRINADYGPNTAKNWPGQQKFAVGDRCGVLLDCGAGSLTMYKNGQRLGVAVANGVAGDLHWAACLLNGTSVRLAALPAPPA